MTEYLTFKEVFEETERLENTLNKLLNDKELLETIIEPKTADYDKIYVDGGKHAGSVQEIYVLKEDLPRWKDLDERIQKVQARIKNNNRWVDNELKILKKYDDKIEKIVYLKEHSDKKYTWLQIANIVYISESHCRYLYRQYKKRRG